MKSFQKWLVPLLAAVLLAGCGGEEGPGVTGSPGSATGEQQEETASGDSTVSASGEEKEAQTAESIEERIRALEVRTWQDICGESISPEDAMRNSARENMGYLTWSGNGERIYYSDLSEKKIYACTAEGKEKVCLYDAAGWYLNIRSGFLYTLLPGTEKKGIVKINCDTGEVLDVFTEPCGEFFFLQDQLYLNTAEGFCVYNEEDGSRTYCGKELEVANIQLCRDTILANAINGEDSSFFIKGYLMGYDTVEEQFFLVKENALWPVAAGDWLSFFDTGTNSRHVLDRVTGEETDLGVYASYVASDGASLYYQDKDSQIYCWDGQKATALFPAEDTVQYFYLTPTHLYWMQNDKTWWYYDLESGKSGNL